MRKKLALFLVFIAALVLFLFVLLSIRVVMAETYEPEVEKLRAEFEKIVGFKLTPEEGYLRLVLRDAIGKILSVKENDRSQYFIYVDRNPEKQIILVCF